MESSFCLPDVNASSHHNCAYSTPSLGLKSDSSDDDCFIRDTPILIGPDGSTTKIADLYDRKYSGPIVSWTSRYGTGVSRVVRVTRRPVGRQLIRIVTQQHGYARDGSRLGPRTERVRYGSRIVICTTDHPIWTASGWVSAGRLTPGGIVKHETVAPKDPSYQNKYKHSQAGRASLASHADIKRFGVPYVPTGMLNRGGNGFGPSTHETLLLERLGYPWVYSHVVPTGGRASGYPSCYKIDVANPNTMVAIEIDGSSHLHRKEEDARKEAFLVERGWTVVRLSNEEVISLSDDLLLERIPQCPVDAEVVVVEEWTNRTHTHVYGLEVSHTHCYFAHGLLVHDCSDSETSSLYLPQFAIEPKDLAMDESAK